VPEGTVNQSKKRRAKKNLKKAKAREDEAFAEVRKKAAEEAALRAKMKEGGKNEGKFLTAIGKVLKKKTAPKKKVVDENGSEWQVTDTRKTAEESDSEHEVNSDSDDEIAFA
jgi:hypothetical protein